ncbi:hypothetical protein PENTCL1PPCAC_15770, partial [Pristionchus entomophagus]
KCRLDRFDAVMAAGRTEEQQAKEELSNITPSPSSSTQSGSPIEMPDQLNFDFNTAMQGTSAEIFTPPQTPSHSIIEKIRSNYRTLSIMRRTAEFQMRGIFLDPFEADKEEYEVIPCTYQMMNEATRILITGLFDFIPALFPEFEALSVADKWLLIRNYQKIFHCLDSCFRMHRRWGIEKGLCFGSYTTYLSEDTVDVYFSDCTDQKNVSDAARTLRDCIQENCVKMKKQISRVQPTEDEYLALMGIAFWSVENAEPNENLMNLAARYRTEILSDLKARYKQTIGEEEGTIRIGGLYCLLLAVKKAEMNMKWEYEVYRILNVFDDNTYMYKLQLHRPDIES